MSDSEKWIIPLRKNPDARLRLFLFHYAAGTASMYRTWVDGLPEDLEIFALQLPGRESRMSEPLLTSIPEILENVHRVILPLLSKPWVCFGHSMGCLLGFELLRKLRKNGDPLPERFFASGRRGPSLPARFPDMHSLTDAELINALRRYGGTPEEILREKEFMDMLFPIIRADFQALETHTIAEEEPLDVPFSVYSGRDDDRALPGELEDWKTHTTAEFTLRLFDGGHFYVNTHREAVLRALTEDLNKIPVG